MRRNLQGVLAGTIAVTMTCCLDMPKETPGSSANLLPPGTTVPDVSTNGILSAQIQAHDGIDDQTAANAGNVITRGTGESDGAEVRFWAFGPASRIPAALYVFGKRNADKVFVPNSHLPLVDSLPGDLAYNPIHAIYQVVVTDKYGGQLIASAEGLADAIELGYVEPPVPAGSVIDSPIVQPGLKLEVGGTAGAIPAMKIYGKGYLVDMFQLGALRPNPSPQLPTAQASFLRADATSPYDPSRPIFQATRQAAGYTPLSVVIDVDLAPTFSPPDITKDADLFVRSLTGEITGMTAKVEIFTVTSSTLMLPLQVADGVP